MNPDVIKFSPEKVCDIYLRLVNLYYSLYGNNTQTNYELKLIGSVSRGTPTLIQDAGLLYCASDIDILITSDWCDDFAKKITFPINILKKHQLNPSHTSYYSLKLVNSTSTFIEDRWFLNPYNLNYQVTPDGYCHISHSIAWAIYKLVRWQTDENGVEIVSIYEFEKMILFAMLGSAALFTRSYGVILSNDLRIRSLNYLEKVKCFAQPIIGENEANKLIEKMRPILLGQSNSKQKEVLNIDLIYILREYLRKNNFDNRLSSAVLKL